MKFLDETIFHIITKISWFNYSISQQSSIELYQAILVSYTFEDFNSGPPP